MEHHHVSLPSLPVGSFREHHIPTKNAGTVGCQSCGRRGSISFGDRHRRQESSPWSVLCWFHIARKLNIAIETDHRNHRNSWFMLISQIAIEHDQTNSWSTWTSGSERWWFSVALLGYRSGIPDSTPPWSHKIQWSRQPQVICLRPRWSVNKQHTSILNIYIYIYI